MTTPLRSNPITGPSTLSRASPPPCPASIPHPHGGWPLGLLSWQRDDRFPRSSSEPVSCSRRLHAGRRLGNKQAPPNPCSRDGSPNPGFDVAIYVTTRHRRFTHVRLHET